MLDGGGRQALGGALGVGVSLFFFLLLVGRSLLFREILCSSLYSANSFVLARRASFLI